MTAVFYFSQYNLVEVSLQRIYIFFDTNKYTMLQVFCSSIREQKDFFTFFDKKHVFLKKK